MVGANPKMIICNFIYNIIKSILGVSNIRREKELNDPLNKGTDSVPKLTREFTRPVEEKTIALKALKYRSNRGI